MNATSNNLLYGSNGTTHFNDALNTLRKTHSAEYNRIFLASQITIGVLSAFTLVLGVCYTSYVKRKRLMEPLNASRPFAILMWGAIGALAVRLCLCEAFIAIGHFPAVGERWCNLLAAVTTLAYGGCLFVVEFFLWSRQRRIYENRAFASFLSRRVSVLSWTALSCIVLSKVSCFSMFVTNYWSVSEKLGCVQPVNSVFGFAPGLANALFETVSQFILLGLFTHPLVQDHRIYMVNFTGRDREMAARLLRGAVITTVVILTSKFVCSTLTLLVSNLFVNGEGVNTVLAYSFYNVSLFMHVVAVLLTYGETAVILTSPCRRRSGTNGEEAPLSSYTKSIRAVCATAAPVGTTMF